MAGPVSQFSLQFRPRLFDTLRDYRRADFTADLVAGVTVGVIALPLAMALAMATGLKPEAGIVTAVVAGFLISALGGSKVQIGGPAGAFIAILAPIVAVHGPEGLVVCTLLSGLMLIGMGLAGFGSLIKFVPFPLVSGFTSGIAIIILSTQVKDFLGLSTPMPVEFVEKIEALFHHFAPNWPTVALGAICLAAVKWWPAPAARFIPGSIAVLMAASAATALLHLDERFHIATIGTQFGGIPSGFPAPHLPSLSFATWSNLLHDAFTIAILGSIESLLCAVVADGMIDDRHDSRQELLGQGIANIASALFGGMAATGVIARTAANVRSGARTPVAGIVHAITLLLVLLVAAPLARHIPLAALSAVLILVALRMGEWHQFTMLRRWPRSDAAVFLVAFVLTVLVDLTFAVGAALLLAAAFLIRRIAENTQITADEEVTQAGSAGQSPAGRQVPEGVMVFRVFGAFFFGAVDKLETALRRYGHEEPRVLILRMRDVLALDATAMEALDDLREKLAAKQRHLILCGPHTQPLFALQKAGFIDRLGLDNLCGDMDAALARARALLAGTSPTGE